MIRADGHSEIGDVPEQETTTSSESSMSSRVQLLMFFVKNLVVCTSCACIMAQKRTAEQKSNCKHSETEIKNCQSAQNIKELLTTLHHHANLSQTLESEIVSFLQQKYEQYTKPYFHTALNDTKKRLKWTINSQSTDSYRPPMHCQFKSQSNKQWTDGIIDTISTEEKTENGWLTVKYGDSKTKKIQRFSGDLKPIGIDDEEYIPNEKVMEYIAQTLRAAENDETSDYQINLIDILEKKYNVVQLLDDINCLKYDHEVDRKDDKFDEIYEFFKESMTGNECDVNECEHVRRHYRNRGERELKGQGTDYSLLMDTVSMMHCYFVHSFDIDRLSKQDRLKMAQQKGDKWKVQTDILVEKRKRLKYGINDRRARFQRNDDFAKSVDFQSMAKTVSIDETVLNEALKEYQNNGHRLIGDLIDVVFAENEEFEKNMTIWNKLKVDDNRKREIFRLILCGHFNSNQLSRDNMVKLSQIIIARKGLKIGIDPLKKVMNDKKIDGRIFDETDTRRYKEKSDFTKLFETVRDCDVQHTGELYSALNDWLFIVYAAMEGLPELATDTELESKTTSNNAQKFGQEIIDFFLQNPMDRDAMINTPNNEFMNRMKEQYATTHSNESKENEQDAAIETVSDLVKTVIDDLKDSESFDSWKQYGVLIIDFIGPHSDIEVDALFSMMPQIDFVYRIVNHCCPKEEEKAISMVDLVKVAVDELKDAKPDWKQYEDQIISFFRANSDIDAHALRSISNSDFGKLMVEHCGGNKKMKGKSAKIKKKCLEKIDEKKNTVLNISAKLFNLIKERMTKVVDFVSMAKTVGMEAIALSVPLNVYKRHRDRLIGDLIDVVCNEDAEKLYIWNKFKMENHKKRAIFRTVLCRHFKCTDLNAVNFIKISEYIVKRKALKIDANALNQVMIENEIDGQIFDESDDRRHKEMSAFTKLFDDDEEVIRELYIAVKKWNVVEIFIEFVAKEVIEKMDSEKESKGKVQKFGAQIIDFFRSNIDYNVLCTMNADEFGKRIAKHCGSEEVKDITTTIRQSVLANIKSMSTEIHEQPQKVYDIGKRFVFWNKMDKDYVKAKYKDMKEEMMESPLLKDILFETVKEWQRLTERVVSMLETKEAKKVKGNGNAVYIYGVAEGANFDEPHLRALKLYTDYTKLCDQFCWILRDGNEDNVAQIAHWTKTLTETVQCFGTAIRPKQSFLRGVNQEFMFRMIVSQYYIPLSTTTVVKLPDLQHQNSFSAEFCSFQRILS